MGIKKETTSAVESGGLGAIFLFVMLFIFMFFSFVTATPTGPDSIDIDSNETKGAVGAYTLNTSGGYITTFNVTATVQNPRWKAFVGQVSGSFTLDDSSGSTIYDWSLTSVGGEIYATTNASTITWTSVTCANVSALETENTKMSHSNSYDNITATFNTTENATHVEFFVATVNITNSSCPTLNTYVNNVTQDSNFEEVVLWEVTGGNIIYATILETNQQGFDSASYDFQMIVPENGAPGWSGATAYYLYVELS